MRPLTFYKAMADETRLQIMLLIQSTTSLCVCELTHALDLSQPKISRHLALLRESGLLIGEKSDKWVFYRFHPELKEWIELQLTLVTQFQDSYIESALKRLYHMGNRPQRITQLCK